MEILPRSGRRRRGPPESDSPASRKVRIENEMNLSPATPTVGARLRRLAALAASTLLAVAPALQAGPPAPVPSPLAESTGTIKGRLIWGGATVPVPKADPAALKTSDPICKAKTIYSKDLTVDPATKGIADAFAYLVAPTGDYSATAKALVEKHPSVVVDQLNCEYVPYATVVYKQQKLTFKSSDATGHNVSFLPSKPNDPMNPMLPPNGKVDYKIKAAERRPVAATCSIHPWMKGYVFIMDHPFATVTKADGSFEIKDVPAGEQHLIVWQSTKGYVTTGSSKGMAISVKAGETTDIGDIKLVPAAK
jgi:hypothetical protein